MYRGPNVLSLAKHSSSTKRVLPAISIFICIVAVLLLIVATIVISLIPVFLPKKTAVRDITASRSNLVVMSLNTGIPYNSRRKRADNSTSSKLESFIGYKLSNEHIGIFKNLIHPALSQASQKFQTTDKMEASIGLADVVTKRSNRAKRRAQYIIIHIQFYVVYTSDCPVVCKNKEGLPLQKSLQTNVAVSSLNLNKISFVNDKGELVGTVDYIPVSEVLYVSSITSTSSSEVERTTLPSLTVKASVTTTLQSVTTTAACTDTSGYFETETGHTCTTYIDYGFCNGTSVVSSSGINATQATANCCYCGKGRTTTSG